MQTKTKQESVEVYKTAYTVTEEDHKVGAFTDVNVGDTIIFNFEKTTTVEEKVIGVESSPSTPNKDSTEQEIVSVGEKETPKRGKKAKTEDTTEETA